MSKEDFKTILAFTLIIGGCGLILNRGKLTMRLTTTQQQEGK